MNLLLLIQAQHHPIPADITVIQNFGMERVMVGLDDEKIEFKNVQIVEGEAIMFTAEPQAFINWLKDFDGLWTCTNPMLGDWKVVHIKKDTERA